MVKVNYGCVASALVSKASWQHSSWRTAGGYWYSSADNVHFFLHKIEAFLYIKWGGEGAPLTDRSLHRAKPWGVVVRYHLSHCAFWLVGCSCISVNAGWLGLVNKGKWCFQMQSHLGVIFCPAASSPVCHVGCHQEQHLALRLLASEFQSFSQRCCSLWGKTHTVNWWALPLFCGFVSFPLQLTKLIILK